MRSLPPAVLLLYALFLSLAFAQTGPAGHWEGAVQVPDREIKISFDLAKDDQGAWVGSFAQATQKLQNVPLTDLAVEGKSVKFRIGVSGPNAPDFDCTLENEALMNCSISSPGGTVTAPMKRTGDAKVDLPKANPAVSKELEGDWEGALDTPKGSLKLTVHFKNQPDKTAQATMDSPDQNATGLPLTDVAQSGSTVEFQLRLANGAYKGTLNKDGTQLNGEWTQGGNSLPLNLKKSPAK